MKSILFVDDEPKVIQGYNRMLHAMRNEWEMAFVTSGEDALRALALKSFDVIVTDIRMSGMDGVQLLEECSQRFPQTVRMVLTGYPNDDDGARAAVVAHQFLTKPIGADQLKSAILRASSISNLLKERKLQRVVAQMKSLPSLPALYNQIMSELEAEDPSADRVGRIISRDISMSAKVLQLVNSAFFGLPRHVSNPEHATVLLGLETIRDLVLSIHVFSQFDQNKLATLGLTELWDHSMRVATFAKLITKTVSQDQVMQDMAFMAGILHDVGKLVLADSMTKEYYSTMEIANQRQVPLYLVEKAVFGAPHSEVGAFLLGLWGLPESVVEAAAMHHNTSEYPTESFNPTTAVHAADAIDHELNPGQIKGAVPDIDLEYLSKLNVSGRMEIWRKMCAKEAERIGTKTEKLPVIKIK